MRCKQQKKNFSPSKEIYFQLILYWDLLRIKLLYLKEERITVCINLSIDFVASI
jgi:hypothetical protein